MNIYQTITEQIIKSIENGIAGNAMPWHNQNSFPINPISGTRYSGTNVLLLWAKQIDMGYEHNLWGTYKQWQMSKAQVNKGEKGTVIIFYQKKENDDEEAIERPNFIAKAFNVFNISQVSGYMPPMLNQEHISNLVIDRHIARCGASIIHAGTQAMYMLKDDKIIMPPKNSFIGTNNRNAMDSYYGILFHELTHWSGAKSRLDRNLQNRFGSEAYAMEELIAELGSAFMGAEFGLSISSRDDHAIYIKSWLKVLKNDTKAIFHAASKATLATQYLIKKT